MNIKQMALAISFSLVAQWGFIPPATGVEVKSQNKPIHKLVSAKSLTKITPEKNKAYAKSQMKRWGWRKSQMKCLAPLWGKESAWNHKAENDYSGAYGIPQALPASKMADAGKDWRTNPTTQIDWGLKYIKLRYSSPCKAWEFHQRNNWY